MDERDEVAIDDGLVTCPSSSECELDSLRRIGTLSDTQKMMYLQSDFSDLSSLLSGSNYSLPDSEADVSMAAGPRVFPDVGLADLDAYTAVSAQSLDTLGQRQLASESHDVATAVSAYSEYAAPSETLVSASDRPRHYDCVNAESADVATAVSAYSDLSLHERETVVSMSEIGRLATINYKMEGDDEDARLISETNVSMHDQPRYFYGIVDEETDAQTAVSAYSDLSVQDNTTVVSMSGIGRLATLNYKVPGDDADANLISETNVSMRNQARYFFGVDASETEAQTAQSYSDLSLNDGETVVSMSGIGRLATINYKLPGDDADAALISETDVSMRDEPRFFYGVDNSETEAQTAASYSDLSVNDGETVVSMSGIGRLATINYKVAGDDVNAALISETNVSMAEQPRFFYGVDCSETDAFTAASYSDVSAQPSETNVSLTDIGRLATINYKVAGDFEDGQLISETNVSMSDEPRFYYGYGEDSELELNQVYVRTEPMFSLYEMPASHASVEFPARPETDVDTALSARPYEAPEHYYHSFHHGNTPVAHSPQPVTMSSIVSTACEGSVSIYEEPASETHVEISDLSDLSVHKSLSQLSVATGVEPFTFPIRLYTPDAPMVRDSIECLLMLDDYIPTPVVFDEDGYLLQTAVSQHSLAEYYAERTPPPECFRVEQNDYPVEHTAQSFSDYTEPPSEVAVTL